MSNNENPNPNRNLDPDPKDRIKTRDYLYKLLISQLIYDGYHTLAQAVANVIPVEVSYCPSERLYNIFVRGLENEPEKKDSPDNFGFGLGHGLDLEYDHECKIPAPEPALYQTAYVTSHKGSCRAGCFSSDGQLVATGSVDASIKILVADRMLAKSSPDEMDPSRHEPQGHPVIRTLYDHMDEVTCLAFHPKEQILCSGSRDQSVKLFDISKANVKKAYKTITETEPIKCLAFHPSGEHLVVATKHPVIRMYDVNTLQCYVCAIPNQQHTSTVVCLKWSMDARIFVSCSKDGSIKLWDGVSNRCINTFDKAHEGYEVCSIQFSKNGKYVLSSGKDSMCRLWELSTSRCLMTYTGAGTVGKQRYETQAVFNHTEDYVLFPDEVTTSLCAWNAKNGSRLQLMSLGHNGPVRMLVHSPTQAAFLSCSDDFRARFWYRRM